MIKVEISALDQNRGGTLIPLPDGLIAFRIWLVVTFRIGPHEIEKPPRHFQMSDRLVEPLLPSVIQVQGRPLQGRIEGAGDITARRGRPQRYVRVQQRPSLQKI